MKRRPARKGNETSGHAWLCVHRAGKLHVPAGCSTHTRTQARTPQCEKLRVIFPTGTIQRPSSNSDSVHSSVRCWRWRRSGCLTIPWHASVAPAARAIHRVAPRPLPKPLRRIDRSLEVKAVPCKLDPRILREVAASEAHQRHVVHRLYVAHTHTQVVL